MASVLLEIFSAARAQPVHSLRIKNFSLIAFQPSNQPCPLNYCKPLSYSFRQKASEGRAFVEEIIENGEVGDETEFIGKYLEIGFAQRR